LRPSRSPGPSVFGTASAPRRIYSPKWRKAEGMILSRCERSCRLPTGRHALWLHLPNWSPRQELHPHDNVRSVACCLLHHAGKVARPARVARALLLVRTEADCLVADGRKSLRDRNCTCIHPFRRRRPDLFAARGESWCPRQESHLRPHPSEGRALITELLGPMEPRAGCAPAFPGYKPGASLSTLAGQGWSPRWVMLPRQALI
jgi:hypothetical protein